MAFVEPFASLSTDTGFEQRLVHRVDERPHLPVGRTGNDEEHFREHKPLGDVDRRNSRRFKLGRGPGGYSRPLE